MASRRWYQRGARNFSERVIREYFLKPFEAAVTEAHVRSVMPSYNEIDGIPSHSNGHLLEDVLRMNGDSRACVSILRPTELRTIHHVVASDEAAAKMALESGVDVELHFQAPIPRCSIKSTREKSLKLPWIAVPGSCG